MSLLEKIGFKSPKPTEEDRAFARRNAIRRGGPEADAAIAEDHANGVEEANRLDFEKNLKFRMGWPQERMRLEKQIQQLEESLRQYENAERTEEANRKKNDERQFDKQSKTDSNNDEQVKALHDLRYMRDLHANNAKRLQEEQRNIREQLVLLRSKIESGNRQFADSRQVS